MRSVTLPLDDGTLFPLPDTGDLIEVGLSSPVRGLVSGIRVHVARGDGAALTIRQTLTLGEDAGNPWTRFARLLPHDPLLAGAIVTDHGDGTVTVLLTAGGLVRVRGTGTAGQHIYIRGGQIEGDAPAMSRVDLPV